MAVSSESHPFDLGTYIGGNPGRVCSQIVGKLVERYGHIQGMGVEYELVKDTNGRVWSFRSTHKPPDEWSMTSGPNAN